jgi:hypothetical protein
LNTAQVAQIADVTLGTIVDWGLVRGKKN